MSILKIALSLLVLLALASCGVLIPADEDDDPFNPGNGNGNGNGNADNDIVVTVSDGTTPTYTWAGGGVHSVAVVRTDNPGSPVWAIGFLGLTDGIDSGVVHGEVPGGSVEATRVEPVLTPGVEYRVSVARTDETIGWVEFTP